MNEGLLNAYMKKFEIISCRRKTEREKDGLGFGLSFYVGILEQLFKDSSLYMMATATLENLSIS